MGARIGRRVSCGDMANPRKNGTVVGLDGQQMTVVWDDLSKSVIHSAIVTGDAWQWLDEPDLSGDVCIQLLVSRLHRLGDNALQQVNRCTHEKNYGPQCCAEDGHKGPHQFLCVSEHPPGQPFTVSVQPEPVKAGYTPGPWRWVRVGPALYLVGANTADEDANVEPIIDDGSAYGEYGAHIKSADEPNARMIAAVPELLEAVFCLGGGSTYIEQSGRLCFCPNYGKDIESDKHTTSCNDTWDAYLKATKGKLSGAQSSVKGE